MRTHRLVAIDKPPWMLSVPGKGPDKQDCAAARVRAMFPDATGPLVVHRLDMETSGILIFGLDSDAQRELSRQFERREVEKRYIALVRGDLDPSLGNDGVIELPIRADLANRPLQIVDHHHGDPSVTRWRVIERDVEVTTSEHGSPQSRGLQPALPPPLQYLSAGQIRATRIEFEPLTGRTHQLRIHAATPAAQGGLGAAIVGDMLYGPERERAALEEGWRPERLMLHASRLAVIDPDSIAPRQQRRPGRGAQAPPTPPSAARVRLVIESRPAF